MKHIILLGLIFFVSLYSYPQNQNKILKSWIKSETINLSDKPFDPDTLYTRYTFERSTLYISFYPAWDDFKQKWSVNGNNLTIGFDTYKIEELTDTSLTIALEGFRRLKFLSEDYLSTQEKNLIQIGEFKGKPLYKATSFITPRYSKKTSLKDFIQKNLEGYNIKKATYFLATFIVTEEGKIENIQIVQGITDGFNNEIIKQLLKTSKDWKPAQFLGKPIQTQMFYDIKYLNSLTPYNSGSLN